MLNTSKRHCLLLLSLGKKWSIAAQLSYLFALLLMTGCASVYKPVNEALGTESIGSKEGYRYNSNNQHDFGDYHIILSFSGGGTRAAALSYGVMQELKDTYINNGQLSLLDEVDAISSVSGGSFTAAYYGVFGDKLFTHYEKDFLRQSVQGALIRRILNPAHWFRSIFSAFDRTEMAVDYYDSTIFKGATFADIDVQNGPFIGINATDLSRGIRFSFTQNYFDLICSDISSFPVARAVTASSAVPVVFPSIILKNYAGECELSASPLGNILAVSHFETERQKALISSWKTYRDQEKRPYIHLVDGGISDNLGLRAILERVEAVPTLEEESPEPLPQKMLIILVNAATNQENTIDNTASKPSSRQTLAAINDISISQYSFETMQLLNETIAHRKKLTTGNIEEKEIYMVELKFESIEVLSLKRYFNNLPTSLELSDEEIDSLIEGGRNLLRNSVEFKLFLEQHGGTQAVKTSPADNSN